MYQKKTNHKTHKKYSIEEKIQIALLYLDHHMGVSEIIRRYDIVNANVLYRWVKQYQTFGTIVETRGKATEFNNPNKERPRKNPKRLLEELTKDELIERVRMLEDIKKSLVYLSSQKPKTNTK